MKNNNINLEGVEDPHKFLQNMNETLKETSALSSASI